MIAHDATTWLEGLAIVEFLLKSESVSAAEVARGSEDPGSLAMWLAEAAASFYELKASPCDCRLVPHAEFRQIQAERASLLAQLCDSGDED